MLFSSRPGPCARVPPPVGVHAKRSAPQVATTSSLPYLVRSHGRPHLFLTALEPPLARVRPSTEASHLHGAASFAIEFQSARCPHAGPSSNRVPDRRPDRAHCPRAAIGPRSSHRSLHQAETPMPLTDELLRHWRRPRHPKRAAPSRRSLSSHAGRARPGGLDPKADWASLMWGKKNGVDRLG
jgi:hypothetical protein